MAVHAKLSASKAETWMNCAGSVRLSAQFEDRPSEAAAEGTLAHEIAAAALRTGARNVEHFLGTEHTVDGFAFTVDREMVDGVGVYLDSVYDDLDEGGEGFVEVAVTDWLRKLHPDLGGTADFVRYRRSTKHLRVWDLKYGAGIFVSADDNKQLKLYALGAMLSVSRGIKNVTITIVQPRIDNPAGYVRDYTFKAYEILEFIRDVQAAAAATQQLDAPLTPSPAACQWCKARAVCPELEKMQNALVLAEFTAAVYDPAKLAAALDRIPLVQARIKALHEFAYIEAERGVAIPGHKLVDKIPRRKWANAADAGEAVACLGHSTEAYAPRELKSPAQIEKLVGGKAYRDHIARYVEARSSGRVLVPDSDKRAPAAPGVTGKDFAVIEGTATRINDDPLSILKW